MTNQEIITAAINRNLKNGWKPKSHYGGFTLEHIMHEGTSDDILPDSYDFVMGDLCLPVEDYAALLIFDHDFAKALWGDAWPLHVQQMVMSDNPTKYLGENINSK